jgi:ribonuclease BN (tRNA processing enzyme)
MISTYTHNEKNPSFKLKSIWSKAGIGTCSIFEYVTSLQSTKNFTVVFDLGSTPIFDETIPVNHVILSHGHLDHIGGIFSHARAHSLCSDSVPSYYVPEHLVEKIEKARQVFSDIDSTCYESNEICTVVQKRDSSCLEMNIVPVRAGEEIELTQRKVKNGVQFYLRPFQVSHGGHPALGYTLITKTSKQVLKSEYMEMDKNAIGELAKHGVQIKETKVVERIELCYSGDTNIHGLISTTYKKKTDSNSILYRNQGLQQAPLLLVELTYLDVKDSQLAQVRGHLNIVDVAKLCDCHGWFINSARDTKRTIIFYHISGKHKSVDTILDMMKNNLPRQMYPFTKVAISAFYGTKLADLTVDADGCVSLMDYVNLMTNHEQKQACTSTIK